MQVKKQQLEPCMEQLTGSGLRKEYDKAVYCYPIYLTYTQNTSWEMPGWMSYKWNQDRWEKLQQPQTCRWHHSNGRKQRGTKEPLDGEEREWKSWLKTKLKLRSWHLAPLLYGKQKGKRWKWWQISSSWALKSLQMVAAAMKSEDNCFLAGKWWEN